MAVPRKKVPTKTTTTDNYAELNKWKVSIADLRMFLASLSLIEKEIPAADLLFAAKSFARKET